MRAIKFRSESGISVEQNFICDRNPQFIYSLAFAAFSQMAQPSQKK
ncbi:MAG: hypothetical protein HC785_08690 [Calothrix sp. CSU_2_0]|nr:hypothetical protein [Calothrix sp. CSU_2_0]